MLLTLLVLLKLHAIQHVHNVKSPKQTVTGTDYCKRCAVERPCVDCTLSQPFVAAVPDFLTTIQEEDRPWAAAPVAWHGVCISPGAIPVGMHQQHGQHGIMSLDLVPSVEAIIHICISRQQQQSLMFTTCSLLTSCRALSLFCRSQH